jgi:hypothetical protein
MLVRYMPAKVLKGFLTRRSAWKMRCPFATVNLGSMTFAGRISMVSVNTVSFGTPSSIFVKTVLHDAWAWACPDATRLVDKSNLSERHRESMKATGSQDELAQSVTAVTTENASIRSESNVGSRDERIFGRPSQVFRCST